MHKDNKAWLAVSIPITPHHDVDPDERLMRSVKIDAPTFDGVLL